MLAAEGVAFDEEGRVLMGAHQWDGHDGNEEGDGPAGPPPDFNWEAELGDFQ